jgi:hypothetical protein
MGTTDLVGYGDPIAMFTLSQTLVGDATTQANAMIASAAALTPPSINPTFPTIANAPTPLTVPLPTFIPVNWQTPAAPAAFTQTLSIGNFLSAAFQGTPPTLNFGVPPGGFSGVAPPLPATNLSFTYPTVSVNLPSAPTLMSIDQVTFNPLAIPTFNVNVPTLVLTEPNIVPFVEKAFYTSTVLSTVQSEIVSALTSDTDIGLSTATQNAMWDAAREREYRQQADALAELDRMESLGYAFPPGAFVNARVKIQTETAYTLAGISRDIMVKQAELRLENVTKTRELAVNLESRLIEYYNNINQRAFENAKYQTESAVAIYNAEVQNFAARLEGYKTQALVYDTQVKGIMAYVEQLKAQIEFEHTKAEINQSVVAAYKTEVDAALANLEVFKTQVEIIRVQAEVEKLKVDTYAAEIQALVAQANAYTAQVEGYKAQVEAQATIERVYKDQVDAYAAEVQAGVAIIQAQIAGYRAQIEAYTAQLDAYKAALQAQVAQAQSSNQFNMALVEEYKGTVSGVSAYNEALTQQWKAIVDTNERVAEVAVKAAEANGQLLISSRNLQVEAFKDGAQVLAQLGAASLNAIHWSNAVSLSQSSSNVTSNSTTNATSNSTSNSNVNSVSQSTSNVSSNSTAQVTSQSESQSESVNTNYNYNA